VEDGTAHILTLAIAACPYVGKEEKTGLLATVRVLGIVDERDKSRSVLLKEK
jgi:hypothetical protein